MNCSVCDKPESVCRGIGGSIEGKIYCRSCAKKINGNFPGMIEIAGHAESSRAELAEHAANWAARATSTPHSGAAQAATYAIDTQMRATATPAPTPAPAPVLDQAAADLQKVQQYVDSAELFEASYRVTPIGSRRFRCTRNGIDLKTKLVQRVTFCVRVRPDGTIQRLSDKQVKPEGYARPW